MTASKTAKWSDEEGAAGADREARKGSEISSRDRTSGRIKNQQPKTIIINDRTSCAILALHWCYAVEARRMDTVQVCVCVCVCVCVQFQDKSLNRSAFTSSSTFFSSTTQITIISSKFLSFLLKFIKLLFINLIFNLY